MVTMNNVIAFIEKAMENKLDILVDDIYHFGGEYIRVIVYHNLERVTFTYGSEAQYKFTVNAGQLNAINIEVTDMEIAEFKLEALRAKEYSQNKTENKLNTFFNE